MPTHEPLDEARAAIDRGDYRAALQHLDATHAHDRATALELRAQAAYGNGQFEAAVTAWEDLHVLHVEAGQLEPAARAAAMIAMYLMMDTGLMSPVRGWLRRAERLLEGHDAGAAHAIIAMVRAYERFMCGDMAGAEVQARVAIELGERFEVLPAVVIGRVAAARVAIVNGDVEAGLDGLDEVGALLLSGRVDALTTGMMYCELICAAQGLALHDRAREWTETMERWRHGAAFGGINGRCRVHRAELLRVSGPGDAAEREALAACEELRPWMRREFGWPLVELGNIRLCRGDLEGAAEAFAEAHEHAWAPHPGQALLRLAEGEIDDATALISDAIAHPLSLPSKERPPFVDLTLAPLFEAQAEIAEAAGDPTTAARAAARLRDIAARYPSPWLDASAALAEARAALSGGDPTTAVDRCSRAIAVWVDIGAPFQVATARMVLGAAHRQMGSEGAARREWESAREGFDRFGASLWRERATVLLGAAPQPTVGGAARGDVAVFQCAGDTRTISYLGTTVLLRDLKGFRYIERMLADRGREFHVLDLVAAEAGGAAPAATSAEPADRDGLTDGFADGIPMLDDAARDAYRRRLAEVDDDIEDATRMNDLGRVELARADREYLIAELARSVGLGGRSRTFGGASERARTSVSRSVRYALERLGHHHPTLAAHLVQSVHTGTYCRYEPDPAAVVEWTT
jgi:tetratricopeptide (TPR) repeat protein